MPSREPDEVIRMDMMAVDLDSDSTYDAVSYVWGDPTSKQIIFIWDSESTIDIRPNLHELLLEFRDD